MSLFFKRLGLTKKACAIMRKERIVTAIVVVLLLLTVCLPSQSRADSPNVSAWKEHAEISRGVPETSRPWTFWTWTNSNITKRGVTRDLETMKRTGIGGAICFNNAIGVPRGPVDYAGEEWFEATEHAV